MTRLFQMWPHSELQTPLKFKWRKGKHNMLLEMSCYPKTVQLHNNLYVGGGGGYTSNIAEWCTVQVYNCNTGVWKRLPEYEYCYFGMVVVRDHLTLVGGRDKFTNNVTNKLGVWNPTSQQWTHSYPPMNTRRMRPEVAIYDKYLLVAGGNDGDRKLTTVEILNVMANEHQWLSASQLPVPCFNMTSAILHQNWFIITDKKEVMYASLAHLCDIPQTASKSTTNEKPSHWHRLPDAPLKYSTAVALRGSLLTVGGHFDKHTSTSIHLYHPERDTWIKVGDLPKPRYYCTVSLLPNEEVLIAGGHDEYDHPKQIDIAAIVN